MIRSPAPVQPRGCARCCLGEAAQVALAVLMTGFSVAGEPGEDGNPDAQTARLLAHPRLQELGEKLFFDTNLSDPPGQSCAACHDPAVGWTGPDSSVNERGGIYAGAVAGRFGNRKPSSAAYATLSPGLHTRFENGEVLFVGGNFWDGRATGRLLGNATADQAQGPFLNPLEQNNASVEVLIAKVERSAYARLLQRIGREVWGLNPASSPADARLKFGIIALAIAAYEHSSFVNACSSKYDAFLKGKAVLSAREAAGLALFEGKGKCANCHPNRPGPKGEPPLFTDFTYDNLGIPANPRNPWYRMEASFNPQGPRWVDAGLGGALKEMPQYVPLAQSNQGKHRVPTLRNVDKRPRPDFVKAYGHNGYFKTLKSIVHFYNTRDVLPAADAVTDPKPGVNCWPKPEVPENANKSEMGNLELSPTEEADLVAFLRILSDGHHTATGEPARDGASGGGK